MIEIPKDESLLLHTDRLLLEPIFKRHADEMVDTLSSKELYRFIPQNPPNFEELALRYEKWESRSSPAGDELWLNWIARRKMDSRAVGHFQAGVSVSGPGSVAYTVGLPFQRNGYAFEALSAILDWLSQEPNSRIVRAWVDTRNEASIMLLRKLGFVDVEVLRNADFFKGEWSDEYVFELNRSG